MRYAIISDIHANLEALLVTIADLAEQQVDQVICLGDIVGYYPNPNECASLCQSEGYRCLRGNHDDATVGSCGIDDFNPIAQAAIVWTANILENVHKSWLNQLPVQILVDGEFLAVHGSPWHPYAYISSPESANHAFNYLNSHYPEIRICFFGHTHQKGVYYASPEGTSLLEMKDCYHLKDSGTYLINPGSVGQARDGIPGASYLVYDTVRHKIKFRHLPYNLDLTQNKVIAAGLPLMLAERLVIGY